MLSFPFRHYLSLSDILTTPRHLKRVFGYARPSDYAVATGMAAVSPIAFKAMERVSPSQVGRGGFPPLMRLAITIGVVGGLHVFYQRSCSMSMPNAAVFLVLQLTIL